MLEQQKSKEKQQVGKKKTRHPSRESSFPCKPTQPPRSSGSRTTSTPPSLPRIHQPGNENNKKKKSLASKTPTPGPPPSTKAIAADLAWWRVRQSPRKKHGLRQGIVHYSTASRPALRCQCARRPREPPVAPPGGELPRYFWSIRRA